MERHDWRGGRLGRVLARWGSVALVLGLGVTGLADGSSPVGAATSSTHATRVGSTCLPPSSWRSVHATAVPGSSTDFTVISFDKTPIRVHWFPNPKTSASTPHPTVLMGPGWGSAGDTDTSQVGVLGSVSISQLWAGGFNVLTWDPRGFGKSGGSAEIDSPRFEARDVSSIISWVAQQPGVELVRPGVPRVGMVGASYGGGIQFVTAATDCRIDAIAPTIAWHSLQTSLYKNGTVKSGWDNILDEVASSAHLAPQITAADEQQKATGTITSASVRFFSSRGPAPLLSQVRVPTLILQGTVDDLFTLDEGIANYTTLRDQGTHTAMVWFCGGHGVCLTNPGTAIDAGALSVAWMQHYVAGMTSVAVPHGFLFVDQNGTTYAAPSYPPAPAAPVRAAGSGTLTLVPGGGSGPPTVQANAQAANIVDVVALGVTPAPATHAVTVPVSLTRDTVLLGAPRLTLSYVGTSPRGSRPTRVFAQLVDPSTGVVLNNQITPIPIILNGAAHVISIPLEAVAFTARSGTSIDLQLVATTVAYATPRLGGSVHFSHIALRIPTTTSVTVVSQG